MAYKTKFRVWRVRTPPRKVDYFEFNTLKEAKKKQYELKKEEQLAEEEAKDKFIIDMKGGIQKKYGRESWADIWE